MRFAHGYRPRLAYSTSTEEDYRVRADGRLVCAGGDRAVWFGERNAVRKNRTAQSQPTPHGSVVYAFNSVFCACCPAMEYCCVAVEYCGVLQRTAQFAQLGYAVGGQCDWCRSSQSAASFPLRVKMQPAGLPCNTQHVFNGHHARNMQSTARCTRHTTCGMQQRYNVPYSVRHAACSMASCGRCTYEYS